GRVSLHGSGRAAGGARVLVAGGGSGVVTDKDGRFLLTDLPPGVYALEIRVPGFRPQRFDGLAVQPGRLTEKNLEVAASAGYVERVVVGPGGPGLEVAPIAPQEAYAADALSRAAQIGNDLQRSVVRLPGAAGGDKSAAVNIRGGEINEVEVLLDGLEIQEPFHLKNFL